MSVGNCSNITLYGSPIHSSASLNTTECPLNVHSSQTVAEVDQHTVYAPNPDRGVYRSCFVTLLYARFPQRCRDLLSSSVEYGAIKSNRPGSSELVVGSRERLGFSDNRRGHTEWHAIVADRPVRLAHSTVKPLVVASWHNGARTVEAWLHSCRMRRYTCSCWIQMDLKYIQLVCSCFTVL